MCFEKRVQRYKKEVRKVRQALRQAQTLTIFNTYYPFSAAECGVQRLR